MIDLLVVGGGRMGEALLGGLLGAGRPPAGLGVIEPLPDRREELTRAYPNVAILAAPAAATGAVLAVKPQAAAAALEALTQAGCQRVLSIVAGLRTAALEAAAQGPLEVVRAMPNTPALIGAGAAAISAGTHADEATLRWAEEILGTVGTVVRVGEDALDAVTGLSGSGPAYIFVVAEAMIEAGVLNGLARPVAEQLTYQTLMGSARLLAEGHGEPAALRAAVTSPGGTTAAGLHELERHGTRAAFAEAVSAAAERARELGA